MIQIGISVPPGFVILLTVFEKLLEKADLNVKIDVIFDSVNYKEVRIVEQTSEKIRALIIDVKISEDIAEEIRKFFKRLNSKYVAVRSSATVEDSANAAWAGQLESYLNTTEENLFKNIKKCWAFLFTPRVIFYRFEKNLHKHKISVAVVVQKMVESEKSGVAFFVHPVTENKNQLIIEVGFGLGEAIVKNIGLERIFPFLIQDTKRLEKAGVDFIVMSCNSLHVFIKEVRDAVDIPVLSIVEETSKIWPEFLSMKIWALTVSLFFLPK